MYQPLTKAIFGAPLVIEKMADPELARRLQFMGLFVGSEIVRLDQEVLIHPVRVRGPKREVVLGGGMAMKIVVHLDDGRKLPLVEVKPGEKGHIEGLTGSPELSAAMEILELKPNDLVSMVRRLPPMEYSTIIVEGGRVQLTEGMAAKVWGRMLDQHLQFVSARAGREFVVEAILGGVRAGKMLKARGIEPGKTLILESVAQAQSLQVNVRNPVVISSREGLRLFLSRAEADCILVREAGRQE